MANHAHDLGVIADMRRIIVMYGGRCAGTARRTKSSTTRSLRSITWGSRIPSRRQAERLTHRGLPPTPLSSKGLRVRVARDQAMKAASPTGRRDLASGPTGRLLDERQTVYDEAAGKEDDDMSSALEIKPQNVFPSVPAGLRKPLKPWTAFLSINAGETWGS